MGLVEYWYGSRYRYDGVSEHQCLKCGKRWGRWCGKELKSNEVEPPYCKGEEHPIERGESAKSYE